MPTQPARLPVRTIDTLIGPAGRLEALLNTGRPGAPFSAVAAHPHPLGGGTLHNKVVYHAAKALNAFGLPVLRFNFRGTGLSEGTHDNGRGEVEDVRATVDWLTQEFNRPILFAGFSFGSHVGLRACCGDSRIAGLIGIGLPIHAEGRDYTWKFLSSCGQVPKLFITGDHDPYAPRPLAEAALAAVPRPLSTVWVEGADHFFAGTPHSPASKLDLLRAHIALWLAETYGASLLPPASD